MKKLLLLMIAFGLLMSVSAQFTKAEIQATGLTCAMCSNAINKSVQELSFVESVKSDIKNSSFVVVFKSGQGVDIADALRKAVEDAGFSIGTLYLTGNFQQQQVKADQHLSIGSATLHFLDVKEQVLDGERKIQVVDKEFLTQKGFKKFRNATTMECFSTGLAAECCTSSGTKKGSRVYHVTI